MTHQQKIVVTESPPDELEVVAVQVQTTIVTQITKSLLTKDRERATDVLLQLRYQLSRTVSSIEVK
jgi:hypothetical protein